MAGTATAVKDRTHIVRHMRALGETTDGHCPAILRPKKKRRTDASVPICAQHEHHVWTYDFIFDATAGGKRLKVLSVLDEYTRVALALVPGRSLTSAAVQGVLARLFARHGRPRVIRSDNGPEFIAFELTEWLEAQGAETHHIASGKP